MSRNRTMIRVWVVLAGVALAAACGGDSTTAPTPVPLPPDPTPVPASAGDVQATVEITVVNPVASSDREILVKLYNATDGPNWKNDGNWLTDAPQWHGVTTDAGGRVTVLSLRSNELFGSIPPELGNLSNLETLNLRSNELSGPIPAELGNLANLETLSLRSNELTGSIPAELGDLSNLVRLYLYENGLSGSIPPELGNLSNLEILSLDENALTGSIPAELGNLANLEFLYLGLNALTGPIPAELGDLSNLVGLYLPSNELSGPIPAELGNLANLKDLNLDNNANLSGSIPSEFVQLSLFRFHWFGTGLYAPEDSAFQAWLAGIFSHTVVNPVASSDREILVELYNATNGPNWKNDGNWLTDEICVACERLMR